MVDNINKNTISEILAKKNLNALNKLKNAERKNKRLTSKQKELLDLFNIYLMQFQLIIIIITIIIIIIIIIMRMRIRMRIKMRMKELHKNFMSSDQV